MGHVALCKDCQKEFVSLFSQLCNVKSNWQAWTDFVTMSAIAISNAFDLEGTTHDAREREYLNIIKQYKKREQQIFPQLFALIVNALEADPEQDFLGEIFMRLNLGSHWKGQFFTPYGVSRMVAEMQLSGIEVRIAEKGWVGIHDPCCGAGALLIAGRNIMARREFGSTESLYVAQDIDRTAAMMCYIQLSLLGCAGYVVVADAFRHPLVGAGSSPLLIAPDSEQELWLTPALYHETWCGRIQCERMKLAMENIDALFASKQRQIQRLGQTPPRTEQSPMGLPDAPAPPPLNEGPNGQLTLF